MKEAWPEEMKKKPTGLLLLASKAMKWGDKEEISASSKNQLASTEQHRSLQGGGLLEDTGKRKKRTRNPDQSIP